MNKEIEKAKEDLSFFNEGDYITKEMEHSARVLEEYIKQLEKVKEDYYWKGYLQKQSEDVEICNLCKYRKKSKTLDKVTDKLKEDKNKKIPLAEDMDWVICRKQYAREILNIIEGDDVQWS